MSLRSTAGVLLAATAGALAWLTWIRIRSPNAAQRIAEHDELLRRAEKCARKRVKRPLRLLLFRHGESAMNVQQGVIGGQSNDAILTTKGEKQAKALGKRLRRDGLVFDRLYSSTAVRAKQTAMLACAELKGKHHVIETREVLELCQGEWTGLARSVVYDEAFLKKIEQEQMFFRPPGFSQVDSYTDKDGRLTAPSGESQFDVEIRVARFVDKLLDGCTVPADSLLTVGVFMHGMAIRCFLRRILGAGPASAVHMDTANTSITELRYDPRDHNLGGWHVVRVNDAAHLESSEFD